MAPVNLLEKVGVTMRPSVTFIDTGEWPSDMLGVNIWAGVKSENATGCSGGGIRTDFLDSERYDSVISEKIRPEDAWPGAMTMSVPHLAIVQYGANIFRSGDSQALVIQGLGIAMADAEDRAKAADRHPRGHRMEIEMIGLYPVTLRDAVTVCNLRTAIYEQGFEHVQALLDGLGRL